MLPPFGLFARISASLAGLLGPSGLRALAQSARVTEVVERLRANPVYSPYVQEPPGGHGRPGRESRRGWIERGLARKPVEDLLRLFPFAASDQRTFLLVLLRGFEAENVKRVLRRIGARAWPVDGLSPLSERRAPPDPVLYDLGPHATVPAARLREAASGSLAALVAVLADTPFGPCLEDAMGPAEAMGSTFPLQLAIDDDVLERRYRSASHLGVVDREGARALLGIETDLLTLRWIYRGRFLFGLTAEEVIPRLPGFGGRLSPARARSLAAAPDAATFAAAVAASPYPGLTERDGSLRPDRIDHHAARILVDAARAVRTGLRIDIGQVLAYLVLVQQEVRDIFSIVECVHYGLGEAATAEHLVGALA
jgi:V/A-type H+-transporting ATPase subunit C